MPGHHHHADAAHVGGDGQFHHVGALGNRTRLLEQHHGVEAVVLAGTHHIVLVTADGGQRRELAAEGAHHLVVQVPGAHSQGLGLVHLAPGIRSLEGREVQQTLVHKGQGIGHGPAVFLAHLHGELLVRVQHLRQGNHGLQMGGRVLHFHALNAVQAQREVVLRAAVRLYQRNVHIDVRCHFGRYGKGIGSIFLGKGHPFALQHGAGILQGNQGPASLGGGQVHGGFLPGLVGRLVRRESNHGEGFRVPAVGTAAEVGPVNGHKAAAGVAGGLVPGQYQVAAPIRIVYADAESHIVGSAGGKGAGGNLFHGTAVHIGIQVSSRIVPPPVPAGLVHGIFHRMALDALARGIHHGQFHGLVLVCFQKLSFGHFDAHVGAVGGVEEGFGGEALISAGLFHAGHHKGLQQARGTVRSGQFHLHGGIARPVQPGFEKRLLGRCKAGARIVEAVFLEALEGKVGLPEGNLGPNAAVGCRTAG